MVAPKLEPYEENVPEFPEGTHADGSDWQNSFIWGFVVGAAVPVFSLLIYRALG